jgi:replicative DNA helicase
LPEATEPTGPVRLRDIIETRLLETTKSASPVCDVSTKVPCPTQRGVGIPTGFHDLDAMTGGLHESELVLLASPICSGKNTLVLNIAEQVTMVANVPTLLVSLRNARTDVAKRMLWSWARIDAHKFRTGYSQDDLRNLVEASDKLRQVPFFVDDTPVRSLEEIAACARSMKQKEQVRLLIIDELERILPVSQPNSLQHRRKQLAETAQGLKALASELAICILCISQLEDMWTPDHHAERPQLSHFHTSGCIDRSADVILFLHREVVGGFPDARAELIIAKQPGGPTGTVYLACCDKYARFESMPETKFEAFTS